MERRIIQAAARVFAHKGFKASLMADIAETAGIGKGTIYQYFRSKEDLFYAVFQWLVKQSSRSIAEAIQALEGNSATRLKRISHLVISSWLEMIDFYTLVLEFWSAAASSVRSDEFKQLFKDSYRQFREIISMVLQDGIREGTFSRHVNAEAVAAAIVGTWDALLLQRWFDPLFDPLAVGEHFVDVILKGLEPTTDER